jgi:hypothetical protein
LAIGTVAPFGFTLNSSVTTGLPGTFNPASLTGTLAPGTYFFISQSGAASGSEASGEARLVLTGLSQNGDGDHGDGDHGDGEHGNGNHVPDAGSTVLLLGMALGGLGFIRHRT